MERRLLLVRHCQSHANAMDVLEASSDSDLTEMGLAQADRLARRLADQGLEDVTIVCSPLRRACSTAAPIAAALGVTPRREPRLREGEVGHFEGLHSEAVSRRLAEGGHNGMDETVHGGESFAQVGERMLAAVSDALAGPESVVILVSHGYALETLLHHLFHGRDSGLAEGFGNGDLVEIRLVDSAPQGPALHRKLDSP